MADGTQPDPTQPAQADPTINPTPTAAQEPAPAAPSVPPGNPAAAPQATPEQLVSDFKKDELQTAAAVQGADVPAKATKADIAEAIVSQQPVSPVTVNNYTQRSDNDAIDGSWVDVVDGPYVGRYGAYVQTLSHKPDGYPNTILVRTRDARNELIEVEYEQVRPSERTGGR